MRHFAPTRYIPGGSVERRFDDIPAVVYLYAGKEGNPAAIAYGGKRNKPDWHFRFTTEERREKKIAEWIDGLKSHAARVKEYREKRKTDPSDHTKGAANLKADLEAAFPGVKFSVRSESFSMGDAIRVHWTDGPTTKQVEEISGAYQQGHFDGMNDMYEYDHSRTFDKGSAKYVTTSREISPELTLKAAQSLGYDIPSGESDRGGCLLGLDYENSQRVYRKARETAAAYLQQHTLPFVVSTSKKGTGGD